MFRKNNNCLVEINALTAQFKNGEEIKGKNLKHISPCIFPFHTKKKKFHRNWCFEQKNGHNLLLKRSILWEMRWFDNSKAEKKAESIGDKEIGEPSLSQVATRSLSHCRPTAAPLMINDAFPLV